MLFSFICIIKNIYRFFFFFFILSLLLILRNSFFLNSACSRYRNYFIFFLILHFFLNLIIVNFNFTSNFIYIFIIPIFDCTIWVLLFFFLFNLLNFLRLNLLILFAFFFIIFIFKKIYLYFSFYLPSYLLSTDSIIYYSCLIAFLSLCFLFLIIVDFFFYPS